MQMVPEITFLNPVWDPFDEIRFVVVCYAMVLIVAEKRKIGPNATNALGWPMRK